MECPCVLYSTGARDILSPLNTGFSLRYNQYHSASPFFPQRVGFPIAGQEVGVSLDCNKSIISAHPEMGHFWMDTKYILKQRKGVKGLEFS